MSVIVGRKPEIMELERHYQCPVTEIHAARPTATYFEGKKVFSL